jgi:hypothetical protein
VVSADNRPGPGLFITNPVHRSKLEINTEFQIHFTQPMPNLWYRLWYKLLLGWRWKPL